MTVERWEVDPEKNLVFSCGTCCGTLQGEPTTGSNFLTNSENKEVHFRPINCPAHPIGHNSLNQRELMASPASLSPLALLATLLSLAGRRCRERHQSRCNHLVGGVALELMLLPTCPAGRSRVPNEARGDGLTGDACGSI